MPGRAGAAAAGAWAALRVPFFLGGERLASLLTPPARARPGAAPARGAVRASLAAVRLLARVPGLPWRNTCLYRSVAECLVLRRYGVPALVRIGVGTGKAEGDIVAHAWVVVAGREDEAESGHPAPLTPLALRAREPVPRG